MNLITILAKNWKLVVSGVVILGVGLWIKTTLSEVEELQEEVKLWRQSANSAQEVVKELQSDRERLNEALLKREKDLVEVRKTLEQWRKSYKEVVKKDEKVADWGSTDIPVDVVNLLHKNRIHTTGSGDRKRTP